MFVGGIIAFIFDNLVPGTTRAQRGFRNAPVTENIEDTKDLRVDGYAFPEAVNKVLLKFPFISRLPFMPSVKSITTSLSVQSLIQKRDQ